LERVGSQSHTTGCSGCASSQTRTSLAQIQIILSRAILTDFVCEKTSLYLYAPPPTTTRRTVIEACPKNTSTTLPHVKPALILPLQEHRPHAVTASAHPLHHLTVRAHSPHRPGAVTAIAHPLHCHTARARPLHHRPRAVIASALDQRNATPPQVRTR